MKPKVIILDVSKSVRQLQNILKQTGQLWETPEEIYAHLSDCAQDPSACYTNVLNYVGQVKHGQHDYLTQNKLEKLGMAIGDLGMAIIGCLEHMEMYTYPEVLPYHFHGLCNNALVLKQEQTIFER